MTHTVQATVNQHLHMYGGFLQFLLDFVVCATITCQTSVLIVHAKMMQNTPLKKKKQTQYFKHIKHILNHVVIVLKTITTYTCFRYSFVCINFY